QLVTTVAGVAGADGAVSLPLTLREGGEYRVRVGGADENGRRMSSAAPLWVAAPGFTGWRAEPAGSAQLIADRSSYRPGETATLPVLPADRRISTQSGAISVTLAADRSSYAPGASATLTVTTTDAQGAGVPADLLLGLVGASAAPRHDLGQTFGGAAPPPIAT